MATPFFQGPGLLSNFTPIFLFLFTFITIYGIQEYAKLFGEGRSGIRALIAFSAATLLISTQTGRLFLEFTIPWLLILGIVAFFILLLFRIFGLSDNEFIAAAKDTTVITWLLIFVGVIALFGVGKAFSQTTTTSTTPDVFSEHDNPSTNNPPNYDELPPYQDQQLPAQQPQTAQTYDIARGGRFAKTVATTFTHPKVLGLIVLILISVFAILFLTRPVSV
ncbi:hypothetical protein D6783_00345 [Candidatus Woesearchaeota archaeon]|nr:MAG: hypothetical protein D6783_00345 [Candidatus Woesearchaeota archaeon]